MQRNSTRFIIFLVLYAAMLGIFYSRFQPGQKTPPTPQNLSTIRTQAEQLERQAEQIRLESRTPSPDLSRADRQRKIDEGNRKYQEAIQRYQQLVDLSSKSDAGIDARVQQARLHTLIGQLDQAEQIYKDLAKQFPRREATITIGGKTQRELIGQWAGSQAAAVQKARADAHRDGFLYRVLDVLVAATGRIPGFSYWFALLVLTGILKGLLYPFTKRQFQSMQDMARVAPLIKEVQEKSKGRPADEIHRRTMQIYKENNVSFTAGCLPAIIQMVVLIPLYNMVRVYEYDFRNGSFAWIGSALSHQYPQWLGRNLSEFDIPLTVLYIISMYLTSKITPMSMSADPAQQQQQKMMAILMPLMFGGMMFSWRFPSAFTFYWLVMNIISTIQQYRIIKQYTPAAPASGGSGGSGSGGGGSDGGAPVSPKSPTQTGSPNGGGKVAPATPVIRSKSRGRRPTAGGRRR